MRFRSRRWIAPLTALWLGACGAAPVSLPQLDTRQADELPLTDPSGERHGLSAMLRPARATVLLFWSAGCPCVRRYQERMDALLARWEPRGVQVLGVAANADETRASINEATQERGFRLPIWRDVGGALAEALGARSTPTAVVLLSDGTVVYRGWIDNERLPDDPQRQPWLDDALTRVLRDDLRGETRPVYGCRITRGTPEDEPIGDALGTSPAATGSGCGCKVPRAANHTPSTTPPVSQEQSHEQQ